MCIRDRVIQALYNAGAIGYLAMRNATVAGAVGAVSYTHLEITELERNNPFMLHAKVGAMLAKVKYDIDDEEVLGAIRWHTTGKPNMNLLEKIVYVADYIEPRRDKAPNLKEIRKLAFMDMDLALLKILEDTLGYLGDSPEEVDSMTRETYEYYKAQIKG